MFWGFNIRPRENHKAYLGMAFLSFVIFFNLFYGSLVLIKETGCGVGLQLYRWDGIGGSLIDVKYTTPRALRIVSLLFFILFILNAAVHYSYSLSDDQSRLHRIIVALINGFVIIFLSVDTFIVYSYNRFIVSLALFVLIRYSFFHSIFV